MSAHWLCALPSDDVNNELLRAWREVNSSPPFQRLQASPRPVRLLRLRTGAAYSRHDLLREVRQRPLVALKPKQLVVSPNPDCQHIVAPLGSDNDYVWQIFVSNLQFRFHELFADPAERLWKPAVMLTCSRGTGILDSSWRAPVDAFAWHPTTFAIVETTSNSYRFVDILRV